MNAKTSTARPLIFVEPENNAVVLQFRLLRSLELPRLPEDFKYAEEVGAQAAEAAARPKKAKGDNIINAQPYDVAAVRALLVHLKETCLYFFTGFSYIQRPDKNGKMYHIYRFIFSREREIDPNFRGVKGDLFNALEYLLGRPGLTMGGGMEVYRNPAIDTETGLVIRGKTWLSCNFGEGVFPFQQKKKTAGPKKEKLFGAPKKTREERDALRFVEAGLKGKGKLSPWR